MNDLREALANLEHDRWARWQAYLHSKCTSPFEDECSLLIPEQSVEHWNRQIATPYANLSEQEKDSDRKEADFTLAVIKNSVVFEALCFARSVIIGGEPWTDQCEDIIGRAIKELSE